MNMMINQRSKCKNFIKDKNIAVGVILFHCMPKTQNTNWSFI